MQTPHNHMELVEEFIVPLRGGIERERHRAKHLMSLTGKTRTSSISTLFRPEVPVWDFALNVALKAGMFLNGGMDVKELHKWLYEHAVLSIYPRGTKTRQLIEFLLASALVNPDKVKRTCGLTQQALMGTA